MREKVHYLLLFLPLSSDSLPGKMVLFSHISKLATHPAGSLCVKKTVNPGGITRIYYKKEETLVLHKIQFFFSSLSTVSFILAA